MIRLITALGNPGRDYQDTRHNIGRKVIERYTERFNPVWISKFKGMYAKTTIHGVPIIILEPETYMNKSGESVQACMSFFKVAPGELLVIHDELELGFGEVRIKSGGGLGGHNGLRSLAAALGTRDFLRLHVGIGRPARGSVASFVLSRFSPEEEAEIEDVLTKAETVLDRLLLEMKK